MRDLGISVVSVPQDVALEEPFPVSCSVTNATERPTGPLRVTIAPQAGTATVMVVGSQSVAVPPLEPGESFRLTVQCLALARGVQRVPSLVVVEDLPGGAGAAGGMGRALDTTPATDVLVI